MAEQKFVKGDLVRVAKDLGPYMRHFRSDCNAIVVGSYADQFGGGDDHHLDYTLFLEGGGECSWYHEHQLTLVEKGRTDLLERWRAERDAENTTKGDLDWVFTHGEEVVKDPHPASIEALAKTLELDMWGRRGEGTTYLNNFFLVLGLAEPFLRSGDKEGWLAAASRVRAKRAPEAS